MFNNDRDSRTDFISLSKQRHTKDILPFLKARSNFPEPQGPIEMLLPYSDLVGLDPNPPRIGSNAKLYLPRQIFS